MFKNQNTKHFIHNKNHGYRYSNTNHFLLIFMTFIFLITTITCTTTKDEHRQGTPSTIMEVPFHRGVNLTNWLQKSGTRQIQFTKFTKQDFINIKSLGCDVIRLPINLHFMTSGSPDYTIDPLFFHFLDQIIDWTEELNLHLILDNHTFDPSVNTSPDIGTTLIKVWIQVAEQYRDRSSLIYYEILNEPHGISDSKWNKIQQNVVEEIRRIDKKHTIIIGPAGWNSYNNLKYMPVYKDDNVIYTFHFYDPFLFTHQGANWTDPSMEKLAGVPFPYDASGMPDCPRELKNTWICNSLLQYKKEGTVKKVEELIDIALNFRNKHNVPIFCGEFGVFIPNSNNEDRIYWYGAVQNYFKEKNIPWTIWDYTGGFGLFKKGTNELFDYDLNMELVEALGLNTIKQKKFIQKPENAGFDIYLDYIEPHVYESSWIDKGILDYYSENNPAKGKYCIHWTGADQYNSIAFLFKPVKDLSALEKKGYVLDFLVRGNSPGARFDIRFVDTKTDDPDDHPWRMRITIDESNAPWNNTWKHLQIPLNTFTEHGSWDNKWYNPQGSFDWSAIDRFEIVSEHHNLRNIHFWFDNIRIINPQAGSE